MLFAKYLLGLTVLYLSGLGLSCYLFKNTAFSRHIAPYIGLCSTQIVFFTAWLVTKNGKTATLLTIILHVFPFLYKRRNFAKDCFKPYKAVPIFSIILTVAFVASPQYMTKGEEAYYFTGNPDAFDAILGGYFYDAFDKDQTDLYKGDTETNDKFQAFSMPERTGAEFRNNYVTDHIRLQYSAVSFWKNALFLKSESDAFFISCLIYLSLFSIGLYILFKKFLFLSSASSACIALICSLNNFYLTTFLNGHVGSLMFSATLPLVMAIFLLRGEEAPSKKRIIIVMGIYLLFILNTYAYPIFFFLLPLLSYFLEKNYKPLGRLYKYLRLKWSKREFLSTSLIMLAIFLISAMLLFYALDIISPVREKATYGFRSWGSIFNHIGFLQYFGIWPSHLAFSSTHLSLLENAFFLKMVSMALALGLAFVSIVGAFFLSKRYLLYRFFVLYWIAFFLLFRFYINDSYYLYKFLYITQFVTVISAAMFFLWGCKQNKLVRLISASLAVVFLLTNFANNASFAWYLSRSLYNVEMRSFNVIKEAPGEYLEKIYIDINDEDYQFLSRWLIKNTETVFLKEKSEYLLYSKDSQDIYERPSGLPVWESERYEIYKTPKKNLLDVVSYWPTATSDSFIANQPFRWLTRDLRARAYIDAYNLDLEKSLRFCIKPGPSIEAGTINVDVSDNDGHYFLKQESVGNQKCFWISPEQLERYQFPILINMTSRGKLISYSDPREFNALFFGVALVNEGSYKGIEKVFYNKNDIVDISSFKKSGLGFLMEKGWHALEEQAGESLRWMEKESLLTIESGSETEGHLLLTFEKRPALRPSDIRLFLSHEEVDFNIIEDDASYNIDLPAKLKKGENALSIKIEAPALEAKGDPRQLFIKVRSIKWKN